MGRGKRARRSSQRSALEILPIASACVLTGIVLLFAFAVGINAVKAVRVTSTIETLWNRAHKSAVLELTRFSASGDPASYQAYLDALGFLHTASQLRAELEREPPDFGAAKRHFLALGTDPGEAGTMLLFFRRYREVPEMKAVFALWREGDEEAAHIAVLGEELQAAAAAGREDAARKSEIMAELALRDAHLSELEDGTRNEFDSLAQVMRRVFIASTIALGALLILLLVVLAKRLIAQIRESEARHRRLVEHASDAILVSDALTGEILEANPRAAELIGTPLSALLGARQQDLHPGRSAARTPFELAQEPRGAHEELELRRGDGAPIRVEVSASEVELGGRRVIQSLYRDVTERRRAEEAVRRSERHFRSLIENISDAITIVEPDGTFRYHSPSFQRMLGYAPEELTGRSAFDLVHADDLEKARAEFREAVKASGTAHAVELRFRHRDGSWRSLEVMGATAPQDELPGVVLTARDVTERRRLEEQLVHAQKMESIGRLAGGVAHDFNNLLTAMLGHVEFARLHAATSSELHTELDEVQRSVERAAALTRQLLAFARRQVIEPRTLDLNERVRDMQVMLQRLLGEQVELVTQLDPDLGHVYADPGQLQQVIVNLAVNARDAMPEGGRLTIETRNLALAPLELRHVVDLAAGPFVCLSVRDTGTGMQEEVLQHIFEPFFTTKAAGKGTGLGLATCYGIVKQSGGDIWVESDAGSGTVFHVLLPQVEGALEPRNEPHEDAAIAGGRETVLVAEDEEDVRALAVRALREQGYHVLEAANGAAALQAAEAHAGVIDLLLSDVVMPSMGGRALASKLAAERSGLRVLFVSGYNEEGVVGEIAGVGTCAFLHKPFTPACLVRRVRELLDA